MLGVPRSVCPPVGPSVRPSVGVAVATGKHPQPGGFGEELAGKAPPAPPTFLSTSKNWNRGRGDGAEPGLTGAGVRRELCATPNKYYKGARVSVGHSRWQSAGGRVGGAANPHPFPRGTPCRCPGVSRSFLGSAPAAAPPGSARPRAEQRGQTAPGRRDRRERAAGTGSDPRPAGRLRAGSRRPNPALGKHRADPAVAAPGGERRASPSPPTPAPPSPSPSRRRCPPGPYLLRRCRRGGSGCSGGAWRGASRSAAGAGPGCAAPRCPFPSVENSGF